MTGSQTTQAANDLSSYVGSLETNPVLLSLASEAATESGALQSLRAFETSLQNDVQNSVTPAADFLNALPTQFRSFFGSVYTEELRILSSDGFTNAAFTSTGSAGAAATGTSKGNAAPTQAKYVGASAGVLAGLLGFMMAL